MTIADMKRDLEAKIDAIDENKNVKKKYDNLNTRYEEMEKKRMSYRIKSIYLDKKRLKKRLL